MCNPGSLPTTVQLPDKLYNRRQVHRPEVIAEWTVLYAFFWHKSHKVFSIWQDINSLADEQAVGNYVVHPPMDIMPIDAVSIVFSELPTMGHIGRTFLKVIMLNQYIVLSGKY